MKTDENSKRWLVEVNVRQRIESDREEGATNRSLPCPDMRLPYAQFDTLENRTACEVEMKVQEFE